MNGIYHAGFALQNVRKLDDVIRDYTIRALIANTWHRRRTACDLGISMRTLRDWIVKWKKEGFYIPDIYHQRLNMIRDQMGKFSKPSMEGDKNPSTDG